MKNILLLISFQTLSIYLNAQSVNIATLNPTSLDSICVITGVDLPVWSQPPNCGLLISALDTLNQNTIRLDVVYNINYSPNGPSGCFQIDTFTLQNLAQGNYTLIALFTVYDSIQQVYGNRYVSDTTTFSVSNPTSLFENKVNTISIFPNPVKNNLTFKNYDFSSIQEIEVLNISGQLIHTTNLQGNELNVSFLKPGLYFLRIKESNNEQVLKFIKQ
jgi:hypothetical protein